MLEGVDRRTVVGRRDYAILLLLVTYGLRAREVAALTLDNLDWRHERLRVPERKAGHSTAYPLSPIVGAAILAYLQDGRPSTTDRHVFFRVVAPLTPITFNVVGCLAARHLRQAGVSAPRLGSHTLRHTCVQRLVDAGVSLKVIGDYVGHRQPSSTQIYSKVSIEALRAVACGPGEEVLRRRCRGWRPLWRTASSVPGAQARLAEASRGRADPALVYRLVASASPRYPSHDDRRISCLPRPARCEAICWRAVVEHQAMEHALPDSLLRHSDA
jgi:hypothetical protein